MNSYRVFFLNLIVFISIFIGGLQWVDAGEGQGSGKEGVKYELWKEITRHEVYHFHFPSQMIEEEKLGTVIDPGIVTIKPEIKFKATWVTTDRLLVQFEEKLKPGQDYKITVSAGGDVKGENARNYEVDLKGPDRSEIKIESGYNFDGKGTRVPKIVLYERNKLSLTAGAVGKAVFMLPKTGTQIWGKVSGLTVKKYKELKSTPYEADHTYRGLSNEQRNNPDFVMESMLLVTPQSPLPLSQNESWELILYSPDGTKKENRIYSKTIDAVTIFNMALSYDPSNQGGYLNDGRRLRSMNISFNLRLKDEIDPEEFFKNKVRIFIDGKEAKQNEEEKSYTSENGNTIVFRVNKGWLEDITKTAKRVRDYLPIDIIGDGVFECRVEVEGVVSIDEQKAQDNKFIVTEPIKESTPEMSMDAGNNGIMNMGNKAVQFQLFNIDSISISTKRVFPAYGAKTLAAYEKYYEERGGSTADISSRLRMKFLPMDLLPTDKDVAIKKWETKGKSKLTLTMDEIWGEKVEPGMYLIEAKGDVSDSVLRGYHRFGLVLDSGKKGFYGDSASFGTQALLQVTDIGVMWKNSGAHLFVYAYSLGTGETISSGEVSISNGERTLAEGVLKDGISCLKLPKGAKYLRVSSGKDHYTVKLRSYGAEIDLWNYSVHTPPYYWGYLGAQGGELFERKAFFFTDRSLYRPGEEVNLKVVVRDLKGNDLIQAGEKEAFLSIVSPDSAKVLSRKVSLSEHGTCHLSFTLPEKRTGTFRARLYFPRDGVSDSPETDKSFEGDRDNDVYYYEKALDTDNRLFSHAINVQEFKRNEFEVKTATEEDVLPGAQDIGVSVEACNYTGVPLSHEKVSWVLQTAVTNFYPEKYRDYSFGDHSDYDSGYWASYYSGYAGENHKSYSNVEGKLDEQGKANARLPISRQDYPQRQILTVTTSVVNGNEQEISESSRRIWHPAEVYVGIRRGSYVKIAGGTFDLGLIAVDTEGKPYEEDVRARVKIVRKTFEAYRYGSKRKTTVENNENEQVIYEGEVLISPQDSEASEKGGKTVQIKTQGQGVYLIEVRGEDKNGRPFASSERKWVYGGDYSPWKYNDGIKMDMVADKNIYYPGDVAKVLLQTPIEGEVLVTIEREKVLRSYTRSVTLQDSVIEIPIEEEDAPNVYVSVFLAKGAFLSERESKEPQIRVGYCNLKVSPSRYKLKVDFDPLKESVLPGSGMKIAGKVTTAEGEPADGVEIALYAVDEGTLDVIGYKTPDPLSYFYKERYLRVRTSKMIQNLLKEDLNMRSFDNKGVFIGGGDDSEEDSVGEVFQTRKDFKPCAYWIADLKTNSEGKFSADYTNPDTLTRYRVMAVVVDKDRSFGSADTRYVVNKPVMIEPGVPLFASMGDELAIPVTVSKTTARKGKWKLELSGNEAVEIASPEMTVEIPEKGQASYTINVKFVNTGDARLTWKLSPVNEQGKSVSGNTGAELTDVVEHTVPVILPAPLLKERHYFTVKSGESVNLYNMLSPELQSVDAEIKLKQGTSPVLYAEDSINFLLGYPYGCLEQTSSQTMPWLYADIYSEYFPGFPQYTKERRMQIIQAAADKILRHQIREGALSYWEGQTSTDRYSLQFTPYGALTLIMCKEAGAEVPQSALASLCQYLNSLTEENSGASTEYFSAWVLAEAGELSEARLNKLMDKELEFDKKKEVSPQEDRICRLYLGLALVASKGEEGKKAALEILERKTDKPEKSERYSSGNNWLWGNESELELVLRSRIDTTSPKTSDVAIRLLNRRVTEAAIYRGSMHNTWGGGWESMALGEYLKNSIQNNKEVDVVLRDSSGERTERLPGNGGYAGFSLKNDKETSVYVKSEESVAYSELSIQGRPTQWQDYRGMEKGYVISRKYEKMNAEGKWKATRNFEVGDIVRITMIALKDSDKEQYVAIEDNMPSAFEPINPSLKSQSGHVEAITNGFVMPRWVSNCEYLKDRVRFFVNYWGRSEKFEATYLARVVKAGQVTAPPAKVESMYAPQRYGLSTNQRFIIAPRSKE